MLQIDTTRKNTDINFEFQLSIVERINIKTIRGFNMRISRKSKFSIIAMLDLAENYRRGPITLEHVCSQLDISVSYMEQLFVKLRKAELIKGVRGPGGGYELAKAPREISVADIIMVTEEIERTSGEKIKSGVLCSESGWSYLSQRLFDFLDEITLDKYVPDLLFKDVIGPQDEISKMMNFTSPAPLPLSAA